MSHLKNILNELHEVLNQVSDLVNLQAWEVLDDLLKLIKLFGENIDSNGIRTEEDIKQLELLKLENPVLFANVLYDNLQLLILEYTQLINTEGENNLVLPFNYGESKMALIKSKKDVVQFIHETELDIQSVIKNISTETEAIILIGYGNGLLRANLEKKYHILTIDPYKLVKSINDELNIFFPESMDIQLLQSKLQSFVGLKTEIISHPLYPYSKEFVELLKIVRNSFQEIQIELLTRVRFSEKWYVETLINAKYLMQQSERILNIDGLKNQYQGLDVLMIAGGPSLEEAIPYLKEAQYSYYIVAIGQTVKVLLDHQIVPDFIISIDGGEANAHFFNDLEIDIPLVYSLQVNHQIPQRSKGILIPYADVPITRDLLQYSDTIFSTHPTVALSAVTFANYLGFDSIGLIGQDLSLNEGEYYSSSVKNVSSNNGQFSDTLYDVRLNNGENGKTTPVLANFLSGYKSLIKSNPDISNKLLNHAKNGAYIDGIPYKPLDSLKKNEIKKKELQINKNILPKDIRVDELIQILGSIIDYLNILDKKLNRIVKQKAVTVEEFEKMLRDWDAMIEAPFYRTNIMPLQLVSLLAIQNKIKLHNIHQRTNKMRLKILFSMKDTIQELKLQLENIGVIPNEV